MKKIGIITFYNNLNYGSSLQAFALRSYVQSLGFKAHVINYTDYSKSFNKSLYRKNAINRILSTLLHPSVLISTIKGKLVSKHSVSCRKSCISRIYDDFNSKFLNLYYDDYRNDRGFYAFICGSDQVWKVAVPGLSYTFFLRFVKNAKKVAYAVSLGGTSIPKYNAKKLKKYIEDFDSVSVREKESVVLLNKYCDNEITHVLDPVLLIGKSFWENQIRHFACHNEKYVICYFLDKVDDFEIIENLARELKAKIYWVDTGYSTQPSFNVITPDPIEFISLISNALFVLTDSFHATAFSVLFHKNFYVVKRNYLAYPEQHIRIQSILYDLSLSERLISNISSVDFNDYIVQDKWDEIDSYLQSRRTNSELFLKKSLDVYE